MESVFAPVVDKLCNVEHFGKPIERVRRHGMWKQWVNLHWISNALGGCAKATR
jgi:hypothetical protein